MRKKADIFKINCGDDVPREPRRDLSNHRLSLTQDMIYPLLDDIARSYFQYNQLITPPVLHCYLVRPRARRRSYFLSIMSWVLEQSSALEVLPSYATLLKSPLTTNTNERLQSVPILSAWTTELLNKYSKHFYHHVRENNFFRITSFSVLFWMQTI